MRLRYVLALLLICLSTLLYCDDNWEWTKSFKFDYHTDIHDIKVDNKGKLCSHRFF